MNWQDTLESATASAKASIAVLLVLAYGAWLRTNGTISSDAEAVIGKLSTSYFLPALLFSEIGPLASLSNLKQYWPLIPASLLFQLVALAVGLASHKFGKLPQHYVPMFVFNNVTSLPLLLLEALSNTTALDPLVLPGQSKDAVLAKARVLILINALVGNLTRFALGPSLMKSSSGSSEGAIRLTQDDSTEEPITMGDRVSRLGKTVQDALNPPLVGGLLAIAFGIIPFFQHHLFGDGFLSPIALSLGFIGKLYTALQMIVLGSQLRSKKTSSASIPFMSWLFSYRFFIAPLLSISCVYFVRTRFPNLTAHEPFLDFVLCISNVGPPALTLAAVANMAHVDDRIEGAVAKILTASYIVTPLISLPVTAAIRVISGLYAQ